MADQRDPRQLEQLLGGYAAGTLTPAEKKALFEAALADQTLFDALAEEEPLRELLADPAARAELRAVLGPAQTPPAARSWWTWVRQPALGGLALAAAVGLVTLVVMIRPWRNTGTANVPVEMARNRSTELQPPASAPPARQEPAAKPKREDVAPSQSLQALKREAPSRAFTLPQKAAKKNAGSADLPSPPAVAMTRSNQPSAKEEGALHVPAPSPPPPPPAPAAPAPSPELSFRDSSSAASPGADGYLGGNASMLGRSRVEAKARLGAARTALPAGLSLGVIVVRNGAEVDPAGVEFAIADTVRLMVDVPLAGHLYAIARRGDEPWRLLFPADPRSAPASRVEPKASYYVPAGGALQPGGAGDLTIRLILVPRPFDLTGGTATLAKINAPGPGILFRELHLHFR